MVYYNIIRRDWVMFNEKRDDRALDNLDTGLKDTRPDEDYDIIEMIEGIKIESEHTNCPLRAKIIAKDHLDEIPDYYTRLLSMEKVAEDERETDDSINSIDDMDTIGDLVDSL
jgi:hypothetical protein